MRKIDNTLAAISAVAILLVTGTAAAKETKRAKPVEVVNTPEVSIINEALPVSVIPNDQIVCVSFGSSADPILNDTPFPVCRQASRPGEELSFTLTELYGEGWFLQGVYRANRDYFVFNR